MKQKVLRFKDVKWACFELEGKTFILPYKSADNQSIIKLPDFKKIEHNYEYDEDFFFLNEHLQFVRIYNPNTAFNQIMENSYFDELPKSWRILISKSNPSENYFSDEEVLDILNEPIGNSKQLIQLSDKIMRAYINEIALEKAKIEKAEKLQTTELQVIKMERMIHPTESSIDIYKRIHGIKSMPTSKVFPISPASKVSENSQKLLKELYQKHFNRDYDTDYYSKG